MSGILRWKKTALEVGARVRGELAARTSSGRRCRFWSRNQVSHCSWYLVFGFFGNFGLGIWYFVFLFNHHFALILISHTLFQPKERQCDAGDRLNWTSSWKRTENFCEKDPYTYYTILQYGMCDKAQSLPMAKRTQALSSLTRFECFNLAWFGNFYKSWKGSEWVSDLQARRWSDMGPKSCINQNQNMQNIARNVRAALHK